MQFLGFTLTRTKALSLSPPSSRGGWFNLIREPWTGAWQQNAEIKVGTVAVHSIVFACTTLIATSVAKLGLGLVEEDDDGIWTDTESPAFSPVLRRPNAWQTIQQFIETWIVSKLLWGNSYVLLGRDQRGVVNAMYVLDPTRVTPLVSTDGSVYYEVKRDDLSRQPQERLIVPASEIIHDRMTALWHPLVGISPITACGLAALQGLNIVSNSNTFFANGANPSGFLTAPGAIGDDTAKRLADYFNTNFSGTNRGRIAVGGDGLKYEPLTMSAVDAQLIEQLNWTGQNVCSAFRVPAYLVGVGDPPPYGTIVPLLQTFYSNCLQSLIVALETCLEDGLALPAPFGVELDVDDLIWMDAAGRVAAAKDSIGSGGMSPDEARKKFFGLGPVEGGDTPYLQEQNWPLRLLSARELPTRPPTPPTPIAPVDLAKGFADALRTKALAEGLVAA